MRIFCMAHETQTRTLYQPRGVGREGRWKGVLKRRGYMCTYGWVMLRFDRKQKNSLKQLSFNKNYYLFFFLKQRHYFANKGPYSQSYGFSISHVWLWELDYKKGWAPKNWCFWIVVLEKTLERSLDCKEIKPVNPSGNEPWIFIGGTDAEAPILWPPVAKSQLIRKDNDARKDWRQEEKGVTEDEMVGWQH